HDRAKRGRRTDCPGRRTFDAAIRASSGSKLVRLEGIEPPTHGLEIRCSIRLSYRRGVSSGAPFRADAGQAVGARGFEPPTPCSQSRCATRLRHAPDKSVRSRTNEDTGCFVAASMDPRNMRRGMFAGVRTAHAASLPRAHSGAPPTVLEDSSPC